MQRVQCLGKRRVAIAKGQSETHARERTLEADVHAPTVPIRVVVAVCTRVAHV